MLGGDTGSEDTYMVALGSNLSFLKEKKRKER